MGKERRGSAASLPINCILFYRVYFLFIVYFLDNFLVEYVPTWARDV
ncbi:MAG: hypothetical protein ACI85O_002813, partial [Saprospiraceae bacterium]